MQQFYEFPHSPILTSCSTNSFIVVDDNITKTRLTRFSSNDSGISSDGDSITSSTECEFELDLTDSILSRPTTPPSAPLRPITITDDAHMASMICDDDKKYFCENTAWAWHGEFGRLIMATAMSYNVDYRLILFDAQSTCPRALAANYTIIQLDNAKAQFKCETCDHCWTSMRARCSFHISKPDDGGIVLLKIYTQQCQYCYSVVHPLWYFDEICRVMKNLAYTIIEKFFPNSIDSIRWDIAHDGILPVRRLLQRKGKMRAQHNPKLCEACHLGLCYS